MNVGIMHKIPDTFCPAKWDELVLSFEMNYAYACCKSTPKKVGDNVMEFISKEKINLLNGVQDSSCNFCWDVENAGGTSRRHEYLQTFNHATLPDYIDDSVSPRSIEVNIGNECNFQCTYCNPKFSSKWEMDVRSKPYPIFTDRFFYDIDAKSKDVMDKNIEFLKNYELERLEIIGGEPLLNKKFFQLIEQAHSKHLGLSTNLSAKRDAIAKLIGQANRYQTMTIHVSLDATKEISEFVRYGLDYDHLMDNLNYLIKSSPPNVKIIIGSVMSSITIRDFPNFSKVILPLLGGNVVWQLNYCQSPKTQSMLTLPEHYKPVIIDAIDSVEHINIRGLASVKSVVESSTFNKTMHQEMKHFFKEFSERKKIQIPLCLD